MFAILFDRLRAAVLSLCLLAAFAAPFASAQTLAPKPVEQSSLARDVFATGTLSRNDGALPADLWRGANVRTLALIEVLFAQFISHIVFKQPTSRRELIGIVERPPKRLHCEVVH